MLGDPEEITDYLIGLNEGCHLESLLDKVDDDELLARIYSHCSIILQFRVIAYLKDKTTIRALLAQERNTYLKIALLKQLGDPKLSQECLIDLLQSRYVYPNSILEELMLQLNYTQLAKIRLLVDESYHLPLIRQVAQQKRIREQYVNEALDHYF